MNLSFSLPIEGVQIKPPHRVVRYSFAISVSAFAFLLTYWLRPYVSSNLFDFFLGAIVLSALYVGLGPALLSVVLSIIALDYFFIPPINAFSYELADLLRLTIFGAVAVMISSLSARLKQAKAEVQQARDDLEIRVQERTRELSEANAHLTQEIQQRLQAERAMLEIGNREQKRLGQDLHDGLCQILVGIRLLSEDLKEQLRQEGRPEASAMERIESRLSEALGQADVVSRGLYPVELESQGLMAALQELAEKTPTLYPVTCRFICHRPVLIHDGTVATHLYRIAQEAVMNAFKGGKAKRITIRLSEQRSQVILSIADNGIGFHNQARREGMGLKIMEYRAHMINGALVFKSRRRGNTLLRCQIPIQSTPENIL